MQPSHRIALILAFATTIGATLAVEAIPSYDVDLEVSFEHGTFAGTEIVAFENPSQDPQTEVFFRLFANAPYIYGSAFVQVDTVRVNGATVATSLFADDTVLLVPLPAPLGVGQTVSITLDFWGQASLWSQGTDPESAGYGVLTRSPAAFTLTAFYPILAPYSAEGWSLDPVFEFGDALMADVGDYRVDLELREPVTAVATGVQTSHVEQEGKTVCTFEALAARDFSAVLVSDYVNVAIQTDGYTIRSWFQQGGTAAAERTTEIAAYSYELFTQLVGARPTSEVELVEVPLLRAAGVEFDGLILVGSQYMNDPDSLFFSIIVSHEMGHQWFYADVGNDPIEHPWLDEGFATYLSNEFLAHYFSEEAARAERVNWHSSYDRVQSQNPELSIASPKYAFATSDTYASFVYSGAAAFLYDLRRTLGDDVFYEAVRSYYASNADRIATPEDLFRSIEQVCECSLMPLLSAYNIPR